jgi:nucleoside-diphosphate-sugar epimerase
MTVAVTGAAGLLGKQVLDALSGAGLDCFGIDLSGLGAGREADLCDPAAGLAALEGADAIVHAAAIPRPGAVPPHRLLQINVGATWSVLAAAEALGIRRVVHASSFSVYGLPFAPAPVALRYLPLDEDHPVLPQEAYGLSKWLSEEVVDSWVRRTGGTAISLRMPWLQSPETFQSEVGPRRRTPESRLDLWAYLDLRDAAAAAVAALRAMERRDLAGRHLRLLLSADDTYAAEGTRALAARGWPGVPLEGALGGHDALLSSRRARTEIGFAPRYRWRDYTLTGET